MGKGIGHQKLNHQSNQGASKRSDHRYKGRPGKCAVCNDRFEVLPGKFPRENDDAAHGGVFTVVECFGKDIQIGKNHHHNQSAHEQNIEHIEYLSGNWFFNHILLLYSRPESETVLAILFVPSTRAKATRPSTKPIAVDTE